MENTVSSRSRRLANLIVAPGTLWGVLVITVAAVAEPTPENLALLISIAASGLYTLGLFITRPIWLRLLARRPLFNAALLGIFNAAVVETIFLVCEHLLGAEGIAAHPNLLIDWALTMPWYVLMVITFVRVQRRRRFAPTVVLLLGALYELGADGVVSQIVGILFGGSQLLNPGYWLQLGLFGFWTFIPVYSSMVLAPAWLIETSPPVPRPATPAWRDALKPLLWLIPFTAYVFAVIFILDALNLAS